MIVLGGFGVGNLLYDVVLMIDVFIVCCVYGLFDGEL